MNLIEKELGKRKDKSLTGKLTRLGNKYKSWKAKAPERRQEKKQKLKDELEIQQMKTKIASQRTKRQRMRLSTQEKKRKSMTDMSFGMGRISPDISRKEFKKLEKDVFKW